MDFLALSTDAIGFVGDFLGAVTQDVASHYVTNLVAQRLGQSEAGGQAFHRLQEQPGDQSRRIAAAGVLAELVESDSQFAEQLFRAVEQAHRDQQVVQQSSSQFYVGADQTVTTSGKGAIGIDFSTDYSVRNQTVNKRSRVVALGIFGVIGALVLISFTLVQLIGDSEQNRAEDVAVQFARAAVMGDFVTACALFASDAPRAQSCFSPDDYSTGPLSADLRRKAESVSAVSVQITSDTTARVLMTVPDVDDEGEESEEVFHLTLEDGHWKIFTTS